jgi:hypothetical protein
MTAMREEGLFKLWRKRLTITDLASLLVAAGYQAATVTDDAAQGLAA